MASDDLGLILEQFYTIEELVELLRDNLRYARSFPPARSGISTGKLPNR
jgi:hypothetical protein